MSVIWKYYICRAKPKIMKLNEIVKKLNGEISPVGETNTDNQRFENLKNQCDLVFELLDEIIQVAGKKDSYEFSVKKSAEYAEKYLTEIIGLKF